MNWGFPAPVSTGNSSHFVAADPIVVIRTGTDADEVDFTNTPSSENPWVLTAVNPVALTTANRNDPV